MRHMPDPRVHLTRLVRRPLLALLALLVLAGLAMLSPGTLRAASKQEVWVASGMPGGTYRAVYARNLERLMQSYKVLYNKSTGSQQNLDLLADGKADIAFVQADVYAWLSARQPELTQGMQVVGSLGDECIYIAYREDGRITRFDQLGASADGAPAKLAVGDASGGAAGSWANMVRLAPRLASVRVDNQGGTLALNQLAVGQYDAALWVTDPGNLEHKLLQGTLRTEGLGLMPIQDDALLAPLPDGTRIYRARSVKLKDSWRSPKLDTVCTTALVIMRNDADERLLRKGSDTISLDSAMIVPRGD